jgi:hypothetical protein
VQVGSGKRIVQGLVNDDVGSLAVQLRQERPARRRRIEVIPRGPTVLYPDHLAGSAAHHGRQSIDPLEDTLQIVFRCAVEQADLHVNDDHGVHGGADAQ